MTLMVKEILTIAIGTIIASGFAFYFFGAKDNPSVTLEYRYSNFGLELVVAADRYLDDAVQQQVASARSVGDLGGNVKFDWLVSSLADVSFSSFPLSQYKAIENLIVTNTDRNREARIRIRGLNSGLTAWKSESEDLLIKQGRFEHEVILQPSEQMEIRNYTVYPDKFTYAGSEDVLIYAHGYLLQATNRKTTFDTFFGSKMSEYSSLLFTLVCVGAISVGSCLVWIGSLILRMVRKKSSTEDS